MKDSLYFRAVEILIVVALVAAAVVILPRTTEVYAADEVFSDEEVSEDLEVPKGYDGPGLELNGLPGSDDDGGEPLTQTDDDGQITVKFHFVNKSATVARLKVIDNQHGYSISYSDSCAAGKGDTLKDTFYPYNNDYCFIVQYWAFGWHDGATRDKICFDDKTKEYTITAKGSAIDMWMDWSPKPWYWEGGGNAENAAKLVIDYDNEGGYVGRIRLTDLETGEDYTTGACAAGENETLSVDAVGGRVYRMKLEEWFFGWIWARSVDIKVPDSGTLKVKVTSSGVAWNPKWQYGTEDGTENKEEYFTLTFKFENNSAAVARMYVHYDPEHGDDKYWYSDSCAVGKSDTFKVKVDKDEYGKGDKFNIGIEDWFFGWFIEDQYIDVWFDYDDPTQWWTLTADGTLGDITSKWDPDPFDVNSSDHLLEPATIKVTPKTVKKGKKTTVKVTSNSGAKLRTVASNKKAKSALKKKYVKIKEGKTAKITFTKKAPKGKYTFKVGSPANGKYKGTIKTITINVK